jgi:hypothetical protein
MSGLEIIALIAIVVIGAALSGPVREMDERTGYD